MILVIHGHPYPGSSIAGSALLASIRDLEGVEVRSLYELYPDFDVDAAAEQAALARAGLVVWMHPVQWYGVPGLLKHWFDTVLAKGWAYGEGGSALAGKDCLWVATTGGDERAYSAGGRHGRPFADFAPSIERTARYCAMNWLEPFVVLGAHRLPPEALAEAARGLRRRLEEWRDGPRPAP